MKHERQTLVRGWDQERLAGANVVVAGCGALGSHLGLALARLGVGHVLLIDHDVLKEHNLENQAYDESDLGKPKVVALKERMVRIDPSLIVECFVGRVEEMYAPIPLDAIFGCLDNVAARHFLNYVAVRGSRILIDGGIEGFRGQVKTIIPGSSACQACYPMLPVDGRRASCSSDPIPSTSVIASVVANLQAMQFLKILRKETLHTYLQVDLERDVIHARSFLPNAACELCGPALRGGAPIAAR